MHFVWFARRRRLDENQKLHGIDEMYLRMTTVLAMLALASTLVVGVESARILALFPSPSRSHIISFEALTKELAARGHQVTVISSFPQEHALPNYTDIAVPRKMIAMDKVNVFNVSLTEMLSLMLTEGDHLCDHYLGHSDVQKIIHSKDAHFDLIMIGIAINECMLGFVHKFQAPLVGLVPMGGAPFILDIVGNPSPFAHVPNVFHAFTDRMTFAQRLVNTVSCTVTKFLRECIMLPRQDAKMREYFGELEPIPYVKELQLRTSLLLLNNHFSIGFPKPLLPNVKEVGGMHIRAPKKLPQNLQTFLDGASDGVIYFSLGSNLKASQMSDEILGAFVKTFSGLKQRVLWKADLDNIDGLSSNVMLGKWLPQIDILAHPKVALFISHGGLLSTQEAIYHGVPVLGIPVFGDQQMNMRHAELSGYAVTLEYANVTAASLSWALATLLDDRSYRSTIEQLSARFRDQPSTALQQAAFWTEYVLRHKGAPHMRSAALDLAWYQYFLLDVLALAALTVVLAALAVWGAFKAARTLCAGQCRANIAQPSGKKTQ